jgi:hypothetical protein
MYGGYSAGQTANALTIQRSLVSVLVSEDQSSAADHRPRQKADLAA